MLVKCRWQTPPIGDKKSARFLSSRWSSLHQRPSSLPHRRRQIGGRAMPFPTVQPQPYRGAETKLPHPADSIEAGLLSFQRVDWRCSWSLDGGSVRVHVGLVRRRGSKQSRGWSFTFALLVKKKKKKLPNGGGETLPWAIKPTVSDRLTLPGTPVLNRSFSSGSTRDGSRGGKGAVWMEGSRWYKRAGEASSEPRTPQTLRASLAIRSQRSVF